MEAKLAEEMEGHRTRLSALVASLQEVCVLGGGGRGAPRTILAAAAQSTAAASARGESGAGGPRAAAVDALVDSFRRREGEVLAEVCGAAAARGGGVTGAGWAQCDALRRAEHEHVRRERAMGSKIRCRGSRLARAGAVVA